MLAFMYVYDQLKTLCGFCKDLFIIHLSYFLMTIFKFSIEIYKNCFFLFQENAAKVSNNTK